MIWIKEGVNVQLTKIMPFLITILKVEKEEVLKKVQFSLNPQETCCWWTLSYTPQNVHISLSLKSDCVQCSRRKKPTR